HPTLPGVSLHCQVRSLFRALDSSGGTDGSFQFEVGTTSISDFVSHILNADERVVLADRRCDLVG
ncbi:MAG: hypothetical protein Q8R69_03950, partial [Telluria sp.]|nr:hypothetical protein [Telluria sp.]